MGDVISVSLKNDMSKEVLKALGDKVELALRAIGEEAEGYAKANCPVDSGRLRNSITYATNGYSGKSSYRDNSGKSYGDGGALATPEKNTLYVGTNVEYAAAQEYGDYNHKVGKKHFLRDAITNHEEHYKAILEAILKS